jgi:hypothetical protein
LAFNSDFRMASSFGLITLGIKTIVGTLVVSREQEKARVEFVVVGCSLRWPIMQFGNSGVDQEYTDVKIVFVPDKGHPKLVWKQYQRLYDEIRTAVLRSEKRRRNARLLLSSDQFNPYLQFAFEHFSRTLDAPFDFVRVSSALNQIQPQVNPVLCLIKDYRATWPKCDILDLFIQVAPLVASAIMLDVVRRQLKGL